MVKHMNPHNRRSARQRLTWRLGREAPRYPTGAYEHARAVWSRGIIASAETGDLGFLGHVASHVVHCELCNRTWVTQDRPVQYLEAALTRSPLAGIWRAAVMEEKAGAVRQTGDYS